MNGIQGVNQAQSIAQMMLQGAPSGGPPGIDTGPGGPPSAITSITNEEGQTLNDLRGELKDVVSQAMESYDGTTDLRSHVQGAIEGKLEESGFDLEEVKSAMESSTGGFSPMRAMAGAAGGGPQQMMQMMQGMGQAGSPSESLSASMSGASDSMIQAFMEQFRAGMSLDLES